MSARARFLPPRWTEITIWLAAALSLALSGHHLLLTEIAVLALFAVSLDLVLGLAGIMTLGHGAFFGVGAYAAGIVSVRLTGEPLTGLVLGGLAAAALGTLSAPLLVARATDLSRLMITLGVAMLVFEGANRASALTGGADGLQGILTAPLFGIWEFDLNGRTGHVYALAVLALGMLAARWVVTSPFGLSLRAIRDNPQRAEALGVPVRRRLIAIYAIGAALAGVSGALMAQTMMFVSLDAVALHRSAEVLVVLVLGGVGWLYGGLIGAVVFKLLQDVLSSLTPEYWQFWMGLILIAVVLVGRDRIAPLMPGHPR